MSDESNLQPNSLNENTSDQHRHHQPTLTIENIHEIPPISSFALYREDDIESLQSGNTIISSNIDTSQQNNGNDTQTENNNDVLNESSYEALNELIEPTTSENANNNNNNNTSTNSARTSNFSSLQIDSLLVEDVRSTIASNHLAPTSFTRLSRTVRSFLNATSSITTIDQPQIEPNNISGSTSTNTSSNQSNTLVVDSNEIFGYESNSSSRSSSTSSSMYSLFNNTISEKKFKINTDNNNRSRFEPKSKLFNGLNAKLENLKKKKRNSNNNTSLLYKFANLMSNHENYYTIMTMPMEANFNTRANAKANLDELSSFKKKKNDDLKIDAEIIELMEITNQIDAELNEETNKTLTSTTKRDYKRAFHLCSLCSHCLVEPITLVCGCSFCKRCLKALEDNYPRFKSETWYTDHQLQAYSTDSDSSELPNRPVLKRKMNASNQERANWFRCYSCGKDHDHNLLSFLKPNVLLSNVIDKFWSKNVENRILRNDIRNYVCFCLEDSMQEFDLNKFEYMFKDAYNQDPSNHLLLADLFLLNYFNDFNEDCLKYAKMACNLQPEWAFVSLKRLILILKRRKI